jgi:hypothetical protein
MRAPNVRVISDCTYIYTHQPMPRNLQGATYSIHKHRNLFKVFVAVMPNGRVVGFLPPRGPNVQDGDLYREFHKSVGLGSWLEKYQMYAFLHHFYFNHCKYTP